jgi:hypothetical protein
MNNEYDYHNGVICKHCFKTIDLTTVNKKNVRRSILDRLLEGKYDFWVYCPHCKYQSGYEFKEVKEIAPLEWRKLEAEIKTLKAENLKLKHDALTIIRDVVAEHGEPDVPTVTPTKEPKNVKKDDPKELPYE